MSARACCVGGRRGASGWCARARAPRTRSMPCSCAGRPPVSDLFGVGGRAWLGGLELPLEEAETVAACLRHVEFPDSGIALVEREIARRALDSPEARRLLTVPGVNVICAATLLAAVGDIGRFGTARRLVGYLGPDPRVYQSGSAAARGGRISKRGSPAARWALVEAARSVVGQPGPLRAFYQRIRARRGSRIAVVACARKLAALFWSLLTRGEDYAHQQRSPAAKKPRPLEIRAGAPTRKGTNTGTRATRQQTRTAERQLAQQAEASYKRIVTDRQAAANRAGASVTPGRASQRPSGGKVARQATGPRRPRFDTSSARAQPQPDAHPPARQDAGSHRRRPRAARKRAESRRRPSRGENRGHGRRSKALRDPPASDQTPEIGPESRPAPLTFSLKESLRWAGTSDRAGWFPGRRRG
jgi:hypothetical protein